MCWTEIFSNFMLLHIYLNKLFCSRILGPWAIRICLMENKPIPNYPWPIYNVAMYKYVVTCSGLSKEHKRRITEKVELMGGRYDNSLVKDSTHLVIDKVLTDKYFVSDIYYIGVDFYKVWS